METDPTITSADGGGSERARPRFARGDVIDKFIVIGEVGAGGMGVVLAAYDPTLDRRVALKLLRPETESEGGRARLLREAQALARLSHANVMTVYAFGTVADSVFLAMELVDGQTLRRWLRSASRGWRQVLDVFIAAGRGLAAAHRAGLVHRDFKPDNVLVGADGRVLVTDFGVVARVEKSFARGSDPLASPAEPALTEHLTSGGGIVGTPAYMAPEQRQGHADALSDQYSFCLSLREALVGPHPGWLRELVTRGTATEPSARFASMDALLVELDRDPTRRSRRWLFGGVAVAAVAAAGLVARTGNPPAQVCQGGAAKLEGIWDAGSRAALEKAFFAAPTPGAGTAWSRFAAGLDAYTSDWVTAWTDTCAATRVRGEQSEAILDQRMACLGRRLGEVRALTALYRSPDESMVHEAPLSVFKLGRLAACADLDALSARVPPPESPALAGEVERVRGELQRSEALFKVGRYADALAQARPSLAEAQRLGYQPLVAEALYQTGDLLDYTGDTPGSSAMLFDAARTARAARHDEIEAQAWTELVWIEGHDLGHYDVARRWGELAAAVIAGMHGAGTHLAMLENHLGEVAMLSGKYDEALARHRLALTLREQALGPDHPDVAKSEHNVAGVLYFMGHVAEAEAMYRRGLATFEGIVGPRHPYVAKAALNLGEVLRDRGKPAEAEAYILRALEIEIEAYGSEAGILVGPYTNLGSALADEKRFAEAEATLRRGLAVAEKALPPEHPWTAAALRSLGEVVADSGRPDEAVPLLERALRSRVAENGDPMRLAETQVSLARALAKARTHRDTARAGQLLATARATAVSAGLAGADLVKEIDAGRR